MDYSKIWIVHSSAVLTENLNTLEVLLDVVLSCILDTLVCQPHLVFPTLRIKKRKMSLPSFIAERVKGILKSLQLF